MRSQSSPILSVFSLPLPFHDKIRSSPKYPSKSFPISIRPTDHREANKDRGIHFSFSGPTPEKSISRPGKDHIHVIQKNQLIETAQVKVNKATYTLDEIEEVVGNIKMMLSSMDDGRISVSAYDTAWLALVVAEDEDENEEEEEKKGNINNEKSVKPQFPSCLEWIANNQHSDGSWGEAYFFSAYDRLLCTLACVIALKTWNLHPHAIHRGVSFIEENICKLEEENAEHMTVGFEMIFPSLVEMASKVKLDIKFPDDSPVLQDIYVKRNLKLSKIPKQLLHTEHTTLLHSLEGMQGLDWDKILKLQFPEGSMFYSLASTAYAFMHTRDEKMLRYLNRVFEIFNGAVPHTYPVDLLTRLWAVDRLQRLGISRYFREEINEIMNYVYRYWDDNGIFVVRNSPFGDLDDTAMGFRLLRLHGYDVSPDVFWNFKDGDKFCCFPRQMSESITVMFNFYRASQVLFPGEKPLEEAKEFSHKFIRERLAKNQLQDDKWAVLKDFPGEVQYALDVPWYASLPHIESRYYIEQYGGEYDVWIAKTFYRMPDVNNNAYLELAKLDYNKCQALHQTEWDCLKEWCARNNLVEFRVSERTLLVTYFLATASIFEPERSVERLAWTKSAILLRTISSYFNHLQGTCADKVKDFIHEFQSGANNQQLENVKGWKIVEGLVGILFRTLHDICLDVQVLHDRDIYHHLYHSWQKWLTTWGKAANNQAETELIIHTINLCAGRVMSEDTLSHQQYQHLSKLTSGICHRLHQFHADKAIKGTTTTTTTKGNPNANAGSRVTSQIDLDMQKLVQLVLVKSPHDIDADIKQSFLAIAKTYYYAAYCLPETINIHIAKVLFQRLL